MRASNRQEGQSWEIVCDLRRVVAEMTDPLPEEIWPDTTSEDLGLDSLDEVEMIMALEEHFGVEIDDSDAEACRDLGDVADFLLREKELPSWGWTSGAQSSAAREERRA